MMVTTHQLAEAIDALVLNSTTCFGSGLFLDFKTAHYPCFLPLDNLSSVDKLMHSLS
jgi:hypothetical protein